MVTCRYSIACLLIAGQAAASIDQKISSWRSLEDANIETYNLSVPVDHFHNESRYEPHSDGTFPLRYLLDTSNYRPGGPVIVLAAGETDSKDRLPFLQHGIVRILTQATGGVGVVLEHRYYGTSFPVPNLETANMRFLSTEQALADAAYFANNIRFPGLEHVDLTAPSTPWIIYGGSYAGAFAAFARKVYPDTFWGAISSSGVTEAIEDYWQYYEAARLYAPGDCGPTTQRLTQLVDSVLFSGNKTAIAQFKGFFGLEALDQDSYFASALSLGISGLQNTNWDPQEDSSRFSTYCASIGSGDVLFFSTAHLRPAVSRLVAEAGLSELGDDFVNRTLNYVGFIRSLVESVCRGRSVAHCLGPPSLDTSLDAVDVRSWSYQVCTEWGFFQTGSGTPETQLPLVSRKIDLEASSEDCRILFNMTTRPDIGRINKHGGFNFSYPRVAIIDGKQDPWRQATPHAIGLAPRQSTVSEPFILLDPGVHHWDEYGVPEEETEVSGLPPPQIASVHKEMEGFVKEWVKEWHERGKRADGPEEL